MMHKKNIGKIILIILGIPAFVLLFGFGFMYLWNWIVPSLFHGPIITFWQGLGIILLSKIIFGGFKGKHGGHRHMDWKHKMKEKMSGMTQEEKEQFKQRLKDKCRHKFWPSDSVYQDETKQNDTI